MSRVLHAIEKGLRIYKENSQTEFIDFLFGSSAPGADGGEQDAAPVGSLFLLQDGTSSTIYQKIASANALADWQENGGGTPQIGFRPEKIRAVTGENISNGVRNLTTTPFTDDDGTTLDAGDFAVGEFIISNAGGVAVLKEVTVVSAPNVTFADPVSAPALAELDTFLTPNYLPDVDGQENQALIQINAAGNAVKVADVDWSFADAISLTAGYAANSGNVAPSDSVQVAIAKLDGVNDNQDTLLGTAQGATNLGTFAGTTIADNETVKGALQDLESAHEEVDQNVNDLITLSGVAENAQDLGTFTGAVIADNETVKGALQDLETFVEAEAADQDEIDQNVNDLISLSGVAENSTNLGAFTGFGAILLTATETVKSALQKIADFLGGLRTVRVTGLTTLATVDEVPVASYEACKWLVHAFEEATPANVQAVEVYAANNGTLVDDTQFSKLKLGSNFNLALSVDISAGNMRLRASSSTAGVTVTARRIGVNF